MTKNSSNIDFDVLFGREIRRKRLELSMATKEVARELDLSEQCIYKWEEGTYSVKLFDAFRLCEVLEIRWVDVLNLWKESQ